MTSQPRKRDYKAEEQRRIDRLLGEGWASRAQRERALGLGRYAPGKSRDNRSEYRRRVDLAKSEGYTSLSQKQQHRAAARRGETSTPAQYLDKLAVLRKFGVTEREFEAMRTANLAHVRKPFENWNGKSLDKRRSLSIAIRINEYDVDKDLDPNDWSEARVGYVTSFYRAIVDPNTNYDSLFDPKTGIRRLGRRGFPLTNRQQLDYLVKYSQIMGVDEFERRYGVNLET